MTARTSELLAQALEAVAITDYERFNDDLLRQHRDAVRKLSHQYGVTMFALGAVFGIGLAYVTRWLL